VRRRLWIGLQLVGAIVVGYFVVRAFQRNWSRAAATPLDIHLHVGRLVAAAGLVWACYVILIAAWRGVLLSWGNRLGSWEAARIWSVSNLGKYVPGKVWAVAGMVVLAERAGVAPWAAAGSAVILQALAMGTGAAVVALTGTATLEAVHPGAQVALWIIGLGSLGAVGLLLSPKWLGVLGTLLPKRIRVPLHRPSPGAIVAGVVANLLAWGGYGVAMWLLARGILPGSQPDLLQLTGAFTGAYLAGFLFLIAPGGVGVREGIFIIMLQGSLGLAGATALALASRLLLTLTEVGVALPFLLFPKGLRRGRSPGPR